jgi:hypothetical protein
VLITHPLLDAMTVCAAAGCPSTHLWRQHAIINWPTPALLIGVRWRGTAFKNYARFGVERCRPTSTLYLAGAWWRSMCRYCAAPSAVFITALVNAMTPVP